MKIVVRFLLRILVVDQCGLEKFQAGTSRGNSSVLEHQRQVWGVMEGDIRESDGFHMSSHEQETGI